MMRRVGWYAAARCFPSIPGAWRGAGQKTTDLDALPTTGALDWYRRTSRRMRGEEHDEGVEDVVGDSPSMHPTAPSKESLLRIQRQMMTFNDNIIPEEVCATLWDAFSSAAASGSFEEQLHFVKLLGDLGVDFEKVKTLCSGISATIDAGADLEHNTKLQRQLEAAQRALTPMYAKWFHQTQTMPNGMKLLLDLRAMLLRLQRGLGKPGAKHEEFRGPIHSVLNSLTSQLRDWFQVAWLDTAELSWSQTPPAVLECIIKGEAVHPFPSFVASKNRMSPTPRRLMYSFFHPTIPHEPLVTVQVALWRGIASSVDEILFRDRGGPNVQESVGAPDTAIFYSINATQEGLAGIDLGKFLIQKVVSELKSRPNSQITVFSTLSPIPNYVSWLKSLLAHNEAERAFTSDVLFKQALEALELSCHASPQELVQRIVDTFTSQTPWWKDEELTVKLKEPVLHSIAVYLAKEKRRSRIFDPVGNFHVKNGACMYRLNWLGNKTAMGSAQSGCVMINYLYELDSAAQRASRYEMEGDFAIGEPFPKF